MLACQMEDLIGVFNLAELKTKRNYGYFWIVRSLDFDSNGDSSSDSKESSHEAQ